MKKKNATLFRLTVLTFWSTFWLLNVFLLVLSSFILLLHMYYVKGNINWEEFVCSHTIQWLFHKLPQDTSHAPQNKGWWSCDGAGWHPALTLNLQPFPFYCCPRKMGLSNFANFDKSLSLPFFPCKVHRGFFIQLSVITAYFA